MQSLEDIQTLPPSSLSQTPFFTHLLSSLPSLRTQIKDAVTASTNSWLLEIRNVSGEVGRLALEAMETRSRRWRSRREREPLLKLSRVGSSVEMVTNEKIECKWFSLIHILCINLRHTDDVLDNEKLQVDFKPLYQCIHIYTALDSLEELQRSYQADRKVSFRLVCIIFYVIINLGPIHSDITHPVNSIVFTNSYPRNCRLLYCRVACLADNKGISERTRS